MSADFLVQLERLTSSAALGLLSEWGSPELAAEIALERPASREHGDLATNLALVAAGKVKRAPRELAAELLDALKDDKELGRYVSTFEIAGPGFINLFLSPLALAVAARQALAAGSRLGAGVAENPEKIMLEYVSANPTGPLHVGHARYAAYGDTLRRLLEFAGHFVATEFYINDYGSQMDIFGRSLAARYGEVLGLDVEFPADGYHGDHPRHVAAKIVKEIGERFASEITPEPSAEAIAFFKKRGCEIVLEEMRGQLDRFRVSFDNWFSEAGLYNSGQAAAAINELRVAGEAVDREGALWLQTSRYGDDKDRVLVRGTGEPTYFASDIAYHSNKLSRGYDRLINIWGADHHGYVPRMKAAFEALSHDPGKLEIIIGQLVNVIQMGERKQMSKRAGTMVTLAELLDSIGVDAARFFLVDRSHDSTLDLDLEKAKLKSEENPVYYVQYAHARICSILRRAEAEKQMFSGNEEYTDLEDQERELILKVLGFPRAVRTAAAARGPQRLTAYARELAAVFHVFYHNCPVLKAGPEAAAFRLDLCRLTRNVIALCLDLVGVNAPEHM